MAKLLIVEDDAFLERVLATKLKMAGHEVEMLKDGEGAVEHIIKHRPNLVLLDLILPGKSGFEVLADLRKRKGAVGNTPVIVISKLAGDTDVERAMKLGANGYVKKVETNIGETLEIIAKQLKK